MKDLNEEYYKLMAEKKKMSSEYYETRTAMQELLKAQKNVEMFWRQSRSQKRKKIKKSKIDDFERGGTLKQCSASFFFFVCAIVILKEELR